MSEKKNKKPRAKIGKKALITIIILLILLILITAGTFFYYRTTSAQIREKQERAAELEPDTATVRRGDLTNTLDDISGIVRSNQSVYLYWQTSGTVSAVNVEVGDRVQKGDILAELDPGTIDSSLIDAQVTKEQAEESLERLYTSTLPLEQARTKMVQAKKAVEDAQKALDALGIVREDELEIGVKYQDYQNAVTAYEQAQENFSNIKDRPLDDADRIRAQQMLEAAKSRMDSAKAQYNWYSGETDELDVQKADAALKLAQAQLDDAVRAYNRIKDGPTQNQVRSLQAQIDAAAATINTSKIIAPISGTVAQVEARPYDVITYDSAASPQVLAVRIDDLSSHYIDISVTELDINNISLGQSVTITFDAIPLREYTGTIVNRSNAGTVNNLSVTFSLTIKMDEADDSIKSGMMADVAIVTSQVRDVLYVPQQAIIVAEDGVTRIVQKLMADGSYIDIPVQVGLSAGSNVQVTAEELREGDQVRLTQVSSGMSGGFNPMMNFSFDDMTGAAAGGNRPGGGTGGNRSGGGSAGGRQR